MVVFPNCKINLGLSVTSKRADQFHDLETVFYPLPLHDALEIQPGGNFELQQTGIGLDLPPDQNICARAWRLLKADFPELPPVRIHLHKIIPTGAGLGGGSADAAFTLLLLQKRFRLAITEAALSAYALLLGSDCPFFLMNRPALASGRGEILEPLDLDLSGYRIVLVNPGIPVSTAAAFADIIPSIPSKPIRQIIRQPVETWKNELRNDFETPVFALYPEIAAIRTRLYQAGAVYAAMSGSGSTVFGLFGENQELSGLRFPSNYFVRFFGNQGQQPLHIQPVRHHP